MAYPVIGASINQNFTTPSTSWVVTETPNHLIDDIIVAVPFVDGASYASAASAGWVAIGTRTGVPAAGTFCQAWYRIATTDGTGEAPTFTLNSSDDGYVSLFILRGVDIASVVDVVSAQTDWNSVATHESATVDPTNAGCLLIYLWSSDGSVYLRTDLTDASMLSNFRQGSGSVTGLIAYRQHEPNTASSAVTMVSSTAAEGGTSWVIAFKNASSGAFAPDVRSDVAKINEYGTTGGALTWYGPAQVGNVFFTGLTALNGINLSTAASVTKAAQNEILTTTTTNNQLDGAWHVISSTNLDGKIFSAEFQTSRAGIGGGGRIGTEGILVGFTDGTNYEFHRIMSSVAQWLALTWYRAAISCGNTTPTYYSGSVGDMNWTAITGICYLLHHEGTVADTLWVKDAYSITSFAITGGGSSRPSTFSDIPSVLSGHIAIDFAKLQGGSQTMPLTSIQIGDGTNATYFDASAAPVSYPATYANKLNFTTQGMWNVPANAVSINVKAKSGDTINLTATSLYSVVKQTFTIDAASSAGATYLTTGLALIGYDVTDNLGIGWNGTTFKSCGTVTIAGGGDLTNCTTSSTASTNAAMSISDNGSVLDGCTIDGTGAAYALELGTAVTAITLTDCTLTAGTTDKVHVLKTLTNVAAGAFVVGVHYRINTVGTTDFTLIGASANTIGANFTATGGGSGTGTADQAVKITISGDTSLIETEVTTAGAPAWVAAPQPTLSATGLANTRYLLWNRTTSAELDNTFVTGTAYSKVISGGASSNDVLDLYAFKEGYAETRATLIYSGANASFAIDQVVDTAIAYYRTQESITDYTTLTEFNFYAPDIYIQSDDADGENKLARLFIFYNGVLTTADGATHMRGGVTFNSAFDVVINRSVRAIAVDNVSVTHGLHFTDENVIRVTTDDGTSWIAPPSAPGSIRYAFGVSPGQIETGVSGVDAQDITDIANAAAAAVVADGKTLTVPKFLGLK